MMELGREDFMEILSGQPDLALAVIRSLIARLRHNTSYIEQITEMSRHVARGDYSFIGEFQAPCRRKRKKRVCKTRSGY
jgi:CRP-like cAMP-binding protein